MVVVRDAVMGRDKDGVDTSQNAEQNEGAESASRLRLRTIGRLLRDTKL
jgi:hypothetical protein